jgi:hypothetical protein
VFEEDFAMCRDLFEEDEIGGGSLGDTGFNQPPYAVVMTRHPRPPNLLRWPERLLMEEHHLFPEGTLGQ